jgi:hypothetical protein
MPHDSIERARRFVEEAEIPETPAFRAKAAARETRGPSETVTATLETGKNQAAVVGSDVISFVSGVTAERREAIINSALLAQLVAQKKVSNPDEVYEWYDAYFDVLTHLGWVVQDRSFAEYHENSQNFEAHKAILAVATALLGAAPAALALVKTTIDALHSMDESTPWITIFNRESQTAKNARFQISLVEQEEQGQFFVSLMAFGLEAKSRITQVLFFKARANEATLRHYSGRVTINTDVLDAIRGQVKAKLTGVASDYISTLPDLT